MINSKPLTSMSLRPYISGRGTTEENVVKELEIFSIDIGENKN